MAEPDASHQPSVLTDEQCREVNLILNESADDRSPSTVSKAAREESAGAMEASTGLKLKCFIYALVLVSVGFIAAVIETQTFFIRTKKKIPQRLPIEWVCYGIKCGFILPAIGALLYLQRWVIRPGRIARARIELAPPQAKTTLLTLTNVSRFVELPRSLSSSPSKPFIFMSLLFAFVSCLSFVIEIACGVIAAVQFQDNRLAEISEVIRRLLLTVFIIIQTQFFLIHNRTCIQWQLKTTLLAASHILASNIVFWFLNVGFELREVVDATDNEPSGLTSFCTNTTIDSIARTLYPFLIEYYVMNALLAYAFVANTGRLATAIRKGAAVTADLIRSLMDTQTRGRSSEQIIRTEYLVMKKFSGTVGLGVGLVLVALSVALFVKFVGQGQLSMQLVFYCAQALLYISGIVCSAKLLRALKKEKANHKLSGTHRTDRILLWIGTTAITVNDTYTIWNSLANMTRNYDQQSEINFSMMAACAVLNISQSLMQIYALECALVRKFRVDSQSGVSNVLYGRALLTFLILLNASEWLINTICFSFFFPPRELEDALALSLLAMPLQVFYRFHSIACIHDFKSHCLGEGHEALQPGDGHEVTQIEIEFPDVLGDSTER